MKTKIYEEFMKEYKVKHEVCPECGDKKHTVTYNSYVFDSGNPDSYEDLNDCFCFSCGDIHTVHDRISAEEFKNKGNE